MKKLLFLPVLILLALADAALGQGTNPLRINCPANLTNWICGVASTATVFYPPPTTTAGCPTNAIVTCSPPSGALFPVGTTTVTCRATNSCRESAICTFTVTVARDTIPPVIQCPTNRIVWLCGTAATTAVVTWPPPVATDNADTSVTVSCSPPSGSLFPLGTTTVTCTATDNCTNRTTCTFAVTVARDSQPPTIDCPGNLNIITCAATGAVVNYPKPTAVDNADFNVDVVCTPASGSVFPVGNTTVTCTATDDCTNRTTCTFTVRVIRDTTPPTITCPTNRVVVLCGTAATIPVNFPPPIVSDTVDPDPTVTCVPPSGSAFPPGTNTVVCIATDDCGNTRSCSFTVTVIRDATPPSIVCPTNISVVVASCGATGTVVNYPMPVVVGGVDPQTRISCVPAPGAFFPVGTTTVTCTAEDGCGNRDICSFTVTVRPRPFFDGLCHTPLGLAALNVNPSGELEVSGFGSTGQDGVRIDLGESEGLRWWMRHPIVPAGQPEGSLEVEVRGKTQSGPEVSLSRMTYAYRNGRVSVTPGAPTYEFKLLLDGEVVYRQSGRSGAFNLPDCIPVWNPHCWGEEPSEFPDNPHLPHCMWLLSLSCDVETDGGPVHADTLVVTPEGPLPPFASVTAIQITGREIPGIALRSESLLMFGGPQQPSRPHRALGTARLVALGGSLTLANLDPAEDSGVTVDFTTDGETESAQRRRIIEGYAAEFYAGGRIENRHRHFSIVDRTAINSAFPESKRTSLTFTETSPTAARLDAECGGQWVWLDPIVFVYQAGNPVGGAMLTGSGPLATMAPVGRLLPSPIGAAKLPSHPLGFQLRFDGPALFTLRDGTILSGDEIRVLGNTATPSPTELASFEITAAGIESFTITSEVPLASLAFACPSDITMRVCSTNSVPVFFPPPVVTGGNCSLPVIVVCVPPSGSLFPPGTTVVQCTVTNVCGERTECSFTVTIHADAISPTLTCPTNLVVHTLSPSGRMVCYPPPTVSETNAIVTCDPPSGSVFPIGTNIVTCTVMDACGNRQTCQFTVEVRLQNLRVLQAATPQLIWEGEAVLESADEVTGPWFKVEGASSPYSPYVLTPAWPRRFFRLGPGTGPGDCPCGQVGGAGGVWNLDVPSVRVHGAFRLNGQPFPASFLHGANFFLRNATTGDEVYLGLSNNDTFDRRVVPGKYDIIYEHKIGADVPANSKALLQQIDLASDQVLNIDVPAVRMTGAFTLNGAPPPVSPGETGKILVRDERNGAQTELGETREQTYGALLIPGIYDVLYSYVGGSVVPVNGLGLLQPDVNITVAGVLHIDVPTVEVGGSFLYDGLPAPNSPGESGGVFLVDAATQGEAFIGVTHGGDYLVNVIPGDYDVLFRSSGSGAVAPANSNALFQRGVSFHQDTTFDVNIPTVTVSGEFRVNGQLAPNNAGESARIWLRAGKDHSYLGVTHGGPYQIKIIPGDYDILFESVSSGAVMPANTNTVIGSRSVLGDTILNIDIPAVTYMADLRFNEATLLPPGDDECRIYLEHVASADAVFSGVYPDAGQLFRVLIPGVYRVRYEYRAGQRLPRNQFAPVGGEFPLFGNLATQIDVRFAPLSGDFLLNGAGFPSGPGNNAAVVLRGTGPSSGDSVYLGPTGDGSYSTTIIPGQYQPIYNWVFGTEIPRNQQAEIGCRLQQ